MNTTKLTKREADVTKLLMEGKSNKEIAMTLCISEATVEFHLTRIYAKVGVRSRGELIARLSRLGISLEINKNDNTQEADISSKENSGKSLVAHAGAIENNEKDNEKAKQESQDMTNLDSQPARENKPLLPFGVISVFILVVTLSLSLVKTWVKYQVERNEQEASYTIIKIEPGYLTLQPEEILQIIQETKVWIPDHNPGSFAIITPGISLLPVPRARHTATTLPNGKVLLAGGQHEVDGSLARVDLFDPSTGSVTQVSPLHTARHDHSATLLHDGRVLVTGGYNLPQQWLRDAEIYDPETDQWTVTHPLYTHGTAHTATLMKDGRVLVVGGCTGSGICTNQVEIFDPGTDSWSEAMSLASDRASQTAQLLDNGRVLIAGGANTQGVPVGGDALIYDPGADTWTSTGPMNERRVFAESVRLSNGKILVAGGASTKGRQIPQMLASAEIYDPATNTWNIAAPLTEARFAHKLIRLSDYKVLAIGGASYWDSVWDDGSFINRIEVYDPVNDLWNTAGELPSSGAFSTATLLIDGSVWVAGGVQGSSGSIFLSHTWMVTFP